MYRPPSRRKKVKEVTKPNLIPILDAVFIFIFFLLMSANFIKIFEIESDVPIVSTPKKENKKPLALTVKIGTRGLSVYTGIPERRQKIFSKTASGEYDYESLHTYLVNLKKRFKHEQSVTLIPVIDLAYEEIVKIMDAVRMLNKTDDAIYKKDKAGVDVKINTLFNKIVFGNIGS